MTKKWIPNLLTIFSLIAGLLALGLTLRNQWDFAGMLIIAAALFDSIDGRVARRLNATTEFGKELDALADLVSFGIAPATISYSLIFVHAGWAGCALVLTFPICGTLRLARYNVVSAKGYFIGLPVTIAGSLLTGITILGQGLPLIVHAFVLITLAGLMLSTFKVPRIWA
jgi:CDP-diacylglycerol--serine O-phosphatidyltransferase